MTRKLPEHEANMIENRRHHWDSVYVKRTEKEVSWFQPVPATSLAFIESAPITRQDAVIDIGGGASTLVDHLLDAGYRDISVLDVTERALERSRARLCGRAAQVNWIVSDITHFKPARKYKLWHERAVLHFLTDSADRSRYVDTLKRALAPGGHVIIGTFGPQGPRQCSGLDICRYDIGMLQELFGPEFELQAKTLEDHETPAGAIQQFLYSSWTRCGHA